MADLKPACGRHLKGPARNTGGHQIGGRGAGRKQRLARPKLICILLSPRSPLTSHLWPPAACCARAPQSSVLHWRAFPAQRRHLSFTLHELDASIWLNGAQRWETRNGKCERKLGKANRINIVCLFVYLSSLSSSAAKFRKQPRRPL